MSVEIKSFQDNENESKFNGEIYEKMISHIQEETKKAVVASMIHADTLVQGMIKDVKTQLIDLSKNSNKIIAVQVNKEEVKKLKDQAVSYLDRLIVNAKLGLNTLLVGPAGCGKTFASGQLAEALGLPFGHLNLTAGASETWLFGRQTPNGFVEGMFSKLYRNGGVFLADEIDAADSNLLLAINTAIANNSFYNPILGELIEKHKDFVFIAAANTFGKGANSTYTGRNRLDAATLDRFVMIEVSYDNNIEKTVCPHDEMRTSLQAVRKELQKLGALEVISTRGMERCYLQLMAGISWTSIIDSIVLGWPDDLKKLFDVHKTKNITIENNIEVVEKIKTKRGRPKKNELIPGKQEMYSGPEVKVINEKDEIPF